MKELASRTSGYLRRSWGLKSHSSYRAERHMQCPLSGMEYSYYSAWKKPLAKPLDQEINKKQELERFCAQKYPNLQVLIEGNKIA